MKISFCIASILCATVSSALAADDTTPKPTSDGYQLVWNDEFNGNASDREAWNIEINGNGNGNDELQFYTDKADNISLGKEPVSGENCLIITAKREDCQSKKFTSGRINTKNNVYFTHGKIESRIKFPKTANGLWPAFWLLGQAYDKDGWPRCSEIDILEMGNAEGIQKGTQDRFFNGACHWGFYKNGNYPNYAKSTTNSYSLQDGEFHTFTLEWDENTIRMYLDKEKYPNAAPYYEMGISDTNDDWATGNFFHQDCFILFNLAVGGRFTGILNPNDITALKSGEEAKMYVDWVRVYQKDDLNAIVPDSYTNGIKNFMADDNAPKRIFDIMGRQVEEIRKSGLYLIQTPNGVKKYICSK